MRYAVVLLLAVCAPEAWSQAKPAEARKPYIRCSAIFGLAATSAKEQKAKDAYTSVAMLLSVWASELDPNVPAKEALDATTRELGDELQLLGEQVRKMRESDAAAQQQFRQSLAMEIKGCRAFFEEASKNKPRK